MRKTLLLFFALYVAAVPLYADSHALPGAPMPAQIEVTGGRYDTTVDKAIPFAVDVNGNQILGASENHLGEIGGKTIVATGNFTRPSDTTAYTSGDLVANSTTAGSVTPVTLTVGRGASGSAASGMIRRVTLTTSSTSTTNAQFRIHFYSASPTASNGDNGAWLTTGLASYLGAADVTLDKVFTTGAHGVGVPNSGAEINSTTQAVYILIEARAAYTPTSAEVFTVYVEVLQN